MMEEHVVKTPQLKLTAETFFSRHFHLSIWSLSKLSCNVMLCVSFFEGEGIYTQLQHGVLKKKHFEKTVSENLIIYIKQI